jgi:hypothetical protein
MANGIRTKLRYAGSVKVDDAHSVIVCGDLALEQQSSIILNGKTLESRTEGGDVLLLAPL